MDQVINLEYQGQSLKIATKQRITPQTDLFFFIHGMGCSKESFDDIWQSPFFASKSIFTYDLPGFGDSDKPSNFPYTMEAQATIAHLLIQKLTPTRIHLVGHSMGGTIGVLLAGKIPDKLATFINIESNFISEDCGVISRKTATTPYETFLTTNFPQLKTNFSASLNRGEQLWGRQIDKSDAKAFYQSAVSLISWCDSGQLLSRFLELEKKRLYIYGEKSSQWADSGKKLTKAFEEHKIPMLGIPLAGHFVMNDNPEEFYKMFAQSLVVL